MRMLPIAAVIITRNEAEVIARCISSARAVADEVIVVDSGSTDATCAIARELGARVVHRDWTNYSDQKNFANGLATTPYILSLDADEELSPELTASIQEARRNGLNGVYRFNRLTNYCGTWVRHGGWYPDVKVRLFPAGGGRWEGAFVHEVLVWDNDLPVHHLPGDLWHYSYRTTAAHRERIERYSTLHAQAMHAAGRRAGFIKLWLSPLAKFVQGYLLQGGFLDGRAGLNIAWYSARAVRMKYTKLQRMHQGG